MFALQEQFNFLVNATTCEVCAMQMKVQRSPLKINVAKEFVEKNKVTEIEEKLLPVCIEALNTICSFPDDC